MDAPRLKILMVSADFSLPPFGGIAAHLAGLCPALVKMGHQVTLALPGFPADYSNKGFNGVELLPVGKASGPRFVRYFTRIRSARRDLARFISTEKPDIIHAHDLLTGPPVAKTFSDRIPYLVTNHTSAFPKWASRPGGGFALRRLYGRPHGLIAVSPLLLESSKSLKPGNLELIPNGVDPVAFSPQQTPTGLRESLGIAPLAPVILFAGRFHPVKGLRYLPAIMGIVGSRIPAAKLLIIGGDAGKEERKLAAELMHTGLTPKTITLGRVPHERMNDYYALADLLILPSLMEGISVAALEAMACGVPVVATEVGGMPEVIDDGISGRLVPPRDPQSMAEAITSLLLNDELRRSMSTAARSTIERHFAWPGIAERTVAFYRKVIEARSREAR